MMSSTWRSGLSDVPLGPAALAACQHSHALAVLLSHHAQASKFTGLLQQELTRQAGKEAGPRVEAVVLDLELVRSATRRVVCFTDDNLHVCAL